MKDYINSEIRKKYAKQLLIVPNYKTSRGFYSVEKIMKFDDLAYFLGEVNDHEADITKIGIEFFKEAFGGLEELADLLFQGGWYEEEFKSPKEIFAWLKWWEDVGSDPNREIKIAKLP